MADETQITELIVDARGATAGSAEYVRAMAAAQRAVDQLYDRDQRLAEAQRRGVGVMQASAGGIARTAAAWDRLRSSIDPVAAAEIRAQREIERAVVSADNAVKRGLATEVQAAAVIERLRQQQVIDLQRVRDAQQQVTDSRVADTHVRNDNAAVRSERAGRFETGNIAAQFQDVAVTAAMGMNPLTIGLQQGTQLSAVIGPMGAAGAVRALGAAFLALISPVSLFTIGAVAAVAAIIQLVGAITNETPKAEEALATHLELIEQLTRGYDRAREAATGALERAQMLPRGVVLSDLAKSLSEQAEAAGKLQEKIDATNKSLQENADFVRQMRDSSASLGGDDTELAKVQQQVELIRDLGLSAASTVPDIEAAMQAARELYNTSDDPALRDMANDAFTLGQNLLAVEAQAYASRAAISALQNEAAFDDAIADAERFAAAIGKISGLRPELRSPREQAVAALNEAKASGGSIERLAAEKTFASVISDMDEADRRRKAEEGARGAASAAKRESPADKFGGAVAQMEQEIAGIEARTAALGQATFETERARASTELFNAAKEAELAIDAPLEAQIDALATRYAEVQLAAEGAQLTMANRTPFEELGSELRGLHELLAAGAISWETYARAVGNATANAAGTAIGALANLSSSLSSAFEDNKELAVATAVLKGAESVASAYAAGNAVFGPIGGAAFAAVAALAAAKNVSDVMSVSRTSKSMAGGGGAGATPAIPAAAAAPQSKYVGVNLYGDSYKRETVGGLFERLSDELDDRGVKLSVSYK